MTIDVMVSVDGLRGQIVIVKVRVRIAVDIGRKKYATIRVGDAQARILCLVYFHLQRFEFVGQLLARQFAIVFDEQIKVALLVLVQVEGFANLAKTLYFFQKRPALNIFFSRL
jgi:hypothetical protein